MPRERLRVGLVVVLFALQGAMFVRARFVESRYFCWAPFHSEARYRIEATVSGRRLTDDEILSRYGITPLYWSARTRENWELNSITHVRDAIVAAEALRPPAERARVELTYRENGRAPRVVLLP